MRLFYRNDNTEYAIAQFRNIQNASTNFMANLTDRYPIFNILGQDQQMQVITECFSYLEFRSIGKPLGTTPLEDCLSSAGYWLVGEITFASASYTYALVGCAATTIGYPICAGIATAAYGIAVGLAYRGYKTSVENCNLKYG